MPTPRDFFHRSHDFLKDAQVKPLELFRHIVTPSSAFYAVNRNFPLTRN